MPDDNIQWNISVRKTREEIVSSDSRWSLIRNETPPGCNGTVPFQPRSAPLTLQLWRKHL